MDSLTWYQGQSIEKIIIDSGRPALASHFLVAAIIAANKEKISLEQLIDILKDANDFVPAKSDTKRSLKDLGYE